MSIFRNTNALATTHEIDVTAIERANLADSTKAKYTREVEALAVAGINPLDHQALTAYAAGLKSSRKSFLNPPCA